MRCGCGNFFDPAKFDTGEIFPCPCGNFIEITERHKRDEEERNHKAFQNANKTGLRFLKEMGIT